MLTSEVPFLPFYLFFALGTCDGIAGNGGAKRERGLFALLLFYPFTFLPFYLFTFLLFYL